MSGNFCSRYVYFPVGDADGACSAIPASALDEEDEDEDDIVGDSRDDERSGTRYNVCVSNICAIPWAHCWILTNAYDVLQYSWFHVIFAMAAMYVAMLLTDWNVVRTAAKHASADEDVYIGRSEVAMWIRVVSSWVCMLLYMWSLVAPVIMPDRYVPPLLPPLQRNSAFG